MNSHRYILAPYKGRSSRQRCPGCGKAHEFAPYLDIETGELLGDYVGRCNRENHCGYHYTPKQYFTDNGIKPESNQFNHFKPVEPVQAVDYLSLDYVNKSLGHYHKNNFFLYLVSLFTESVARNVFSMYLSGTSSHWRGATAFWQIDMNEKVRQCKIMLYNARTGKRVRQGATVEKINRKARRFETVIADQDCTKVYGKYIDESTFKLNLQQCFFGEHLLKEYPNKTVAIVESEKTAMIASVYKPEFIWLATGGKYGCRWSDYSVNKVLQGRNVVMFPDAFIPKKESDKSPYEVWSERALQIVDQVKCRIYVSDLLEKVATDEQKQKGWDLLDFLLIKDETAGLALTDAGYPAYWDYK